MQRIILHLDMDAFFAQIEEKENPQFKGKPIVVGADPKSGRGRGVVSTANYNARKYGIHSALPISKAYQLCPKAIFLPVNMELYQRVSENIMEIVKTYSPIFEQVSLDEAHLDLSFLISQAKAKTCSQFKRSLELATRKRLEKGYKKAELLAKKLKKEIFEKEKLTCTIGIGPNKLIAKIATNKAKPDGLLIIRSNQVKTFLEPLDIEEIPGIGPKTAEKLRGIGINKIKELKNLSKTELKNMFGIVGETIYDKARGVDAKPLSSEEVIKSIGREHTFEKDTRDPEIIFGTFEKIIKNVYQELIENNLGARAKLGRTRRAGCSLFKTITVICRFSDFETHTKSKTEPRPFLMGGAKVKMRTKSSLPTLKNPTKDLKTLKKEAKKLLLKFLIESSKLIRLIGLRVAVDN